MLMLPNSMYANEDVKREAFHGLPFAGNHFELGTLDGINHLCVFYADGEPFYFMRDESWDNVDYVETATGERDRLELQK